MLTWKTDAYGQERRALYIGGLYVGGILSMGVGKNWRAWLMTDDEGVSVGKDQWPTEDAARDALFAAATEKLAEK